MEFKLYNGGGFPCEKIWSPTDAEIISVENKDIIVFKKPNDNILDSFIVNFNKNKDKINFSITKNNDFLNLWLYDGDITILIEAIPNSYIESYRNNKLYLVIEDNNKKALVFVKLN